MLKINSVMQNVSEIIATVAQKGDSALIDYALKFDKVKLTPKTILVEKKELKSAYLRISKVARAALEQAAGNIKAFHQQEILQMNLNWQMERDGLRVGQRALALNRVGCYVPGGRFPYPSTVLMTVIPAKVAGVKEVIVVTPPHHLRDEILAACYIAGADKLARVGGPAAIAALAHGTKTIPQVDKIVGPGNKFVTEAKRQVFGMVGIDGLAGPSEVVVFADAKADLQKVLINLMAQAEHDPDARAVLVSRSKAVLSQVKKMLPSLFKDQVEFILAESDCQAADMINAIAPEHLYLALKNPQLQLSKIKNAGAIFVGENAPVPLGDYSAGPSHVLPTAKSARFNSGLSARDFLKWNSMIETCSVNAAKNTLQAAQTLADIEGLVHHSSSIKEVLK